MDLCGLSNDCTCNSEVTYGDPCMELSDFNPAYEVIIAFSKQYPNKKDITKKLMAIVNDLEFDSVKDKREESLDPTHVDELEDNGHSTLIDSWSFRDYDPELLRKLVERGWKKKTIAEKMGISRQWLNVLLNKP